MRRFLLLMVLLMPMVTFSQSPGNKDSLKVAIRNMSPEQKAVLKKEIVKYKIEEMRRRQLLRQKLIRILREEQLRGRRRSGLLNGAD